ncbi:MAG: efflux RND transporter permease subunit [Rhodospirillales bacterium]|nr:efflux RND transporter permease subunit [Rhodospirillales bacterium]
MNLIRLAIERPVAIMAAVLMVVMFGLVALQAIPIQLIPDVRKPIITLTTNWSGAAPVEVEREITNRQEEVLRGLENLEDIVSTSEDGRSQITLEFKIGTNMDKALLLVANRLDRVDGYPAEVKQPTISTSGADDNPIAWFILIKTANDVKDMHTYGDFAEDVIQDRLERVTGVSRVNVYGGSEQQLEIIVNPELMARYGLTVTDVVSRLRAANASVSAGDVDEGKRRYVVRTEGEFSTIGHVSSVLLRSDRDLESGRIARVTVGDIAEVKFNYKDPVARIRFNGQPAMAVNTVRENGANVIQVMEGIIKAVDELNANALPEAGLQLVQVYDETVYIKSSISLVQQNILVGGLLAALMLLLFLRSGSATLVVSLAIPVSVIGAFVAMAALGRSINVISLAGIAFAVGMVVDAAIVVLENIFRHRERGKSRAEAAYLGASQVWGAVLVSALTTVMVFLPILVMELEVGQLFRDIAVALSVSVLLSLLVAVTVIPALANKLLGKDGEAGITRMRIPVLDDFAGLFVRVIDGFTRRVTASRLLALTVVAVICGSAGVVTWQFLPKQDYLPTGNKNLIFGILIPPPGYNLKTTEGIAHRYEDVVRPHLATKEEPFSKPGDVPKLRNFFFVAFRGRTFLGAQAADPERVKELLPFMGRAAFQEPGTFGVVTQQALFGRGFGGKRSIDFNISGPDMQDIMDVAGRSAALIGQVMPRSEGTQMQPIPGLSLGAPEVRILPDRVKLADNGVTTRELGDTIDAFNDGLRVAEITVGSSRMDLVLMGPANDISETQGIQNLPVVTRSGKIIPASSLADVIVTSGPTQVRHIERERTVTLQLQPPENIPLQAVIDELNEKVLTVIQAEGVPAGISINLSGTADQLSETKEAIKVDLLMALMIVYLVMAVLFESFWYPLIIMLSVPLATAGGVLGLAFLNLYRFQALDMLTLLGFVILIGIVVNNAILLVHQTLYHIREENMPVAEATREATRNRIRPIFMSTLTSVFGMMPLVLFPGAGSELYQGLGSVVLGGLALSAVLTLLIVPPLLTLFGGILERNRFKAQAHLNEPLVRKPAE